MNFISYASSLVLHSINSLFVSLFCPTTLCQRHMHGGDTAKIDPLSLPGGLPWTTVVQGSPRIYRMRATTAGCLITEETRDTHREGYHWPSKAVALQPCATPRHRVLPYAMPGRVRSVLYYHLPQIIPRVTMNRNE